MVPKTGLNRGTARSSNESDREEKAGQVHILSVALVILAAILVRDLYFLQYRNNVPYYSVLIVDSAYYNSWAERVVSGAGYGPMPFYLAPLYPYFVALIYAIAGHSVTVVYLIQMLLGVSNGLMVYLLGRRLFGHWAGVAGMGMVFLYGPLMYLESKLLSETLSVSLNLASLLLLARALDRPSWGRLLLAGIVLGAAVICRPVMLIFTVLLSVYLLSASAETGKKIAGKQLALLWMGVLLVILPVTARNWYVGKDFALISTNSGLTFAHGNHPGSRGLTTSLPGFTGSIMTQQQEEMALAEQALEHPVKPSESSDYWFGQGMRFIRENPGEYARLMGKKLLWTLHTREAPCNYNFYLEQRLTGVLRFFALPFPMILGLGIFGYVAGRGRSRLADIVMLYSASVLLSLLIFYVSSRYRAPAVPGLAVLAGFGLVHVLDRLRMKRMDVLLPLAACVAPITAVSLVPYPIPKVTVEAISNLGASYSAAGELKKAKDALKQAIRANPRYAAAHLNLGIVYAQEGRIAEAESEFRRVLELQPENATAHDKLGMALARQNKLREAELHHRRAIRIRPDYADAHYNLAVVLYFDGRYSEAMRELRLAERYGYEPRQAFVRALEQKAERGKDTEW